MVSLSYLACYTTRCSSNAGHHDKPKPKFARIKINGTCGLSPIKVLGGVKTGEALSVGNGHVLKENARQELIMDDRKYRETYVIRSTEVGPDKVATFENIVNLLQETALNQVKMIGLHCDGFGATHEMIRNNLIWVVARKQVEVDRYPIWGEKIDVDTWFAPLKRNGLRRDWLVRSNATGLVIARATSTWVLMNRETRRLAKLPESVRAEILSWFNYKATFKDDNEKIEKLDIDKAKYVISNSQAKRSDMDMNNHVNNVKYVSWMFEVIPDQILETYQLSSIVLDYRKECGTSDIVESLCELHDDDDDDGIVRDEFERAQLRFTHLLQIKGDTKTEAIVRGITTWKRNPNYLVY